MTDRCVTNHTNALLVAENLVPALAGEPPPALHMGLEQGRCAGVSATDIDLRTAYLRALAVVDEPADGEVWFRGQAVATLSPRAWRNLRQKIAFITRQAPLLSVVNGLQNLLIPALYHGIDTSQALAARANDLLKTAEFTGDTSLLPAFLTNLQRRQLAICRAVMLAPDIIFIDDPFAGLEPEAEIVLARFIQRLKKQGYTLVLASNAVQRLLPLTDQCLFLCADQIVYLPDCTQLWQREEPEIIAFLASRGIAHLPKRAEFTP